MSDITRWLEGGQDGPNLQAVFDQLYPELKRLAQVRLQGMRAGQTLTPTALVHEAYDRLVHAAQLDLRGRRHFFATAGKCMRHIIVDHLRSANAQKRGGDQIAVTLTDNIAGDNDAGSLLDLDRAMDELDQIQPMQRELVELRFFAGLPMSEIAELLEISDRTAWREWQKARAFLHARMGQG
ncbi:MAG: sigma-70 family RNA polymerase sigma factor [Wenzhouxiangella sp.]|nr:sigma-70 family RNA polymerase sigma factor [Wenzhouxiangella sp.]MCH8476651.1 sigma-70 family RNA polymerase sigma factor [Wenzhouxiangella sp.]TVR92574.1 MAG: sigma-70 family RNA polymerase sigma factor [Wenzhouxiangellaceae bacterium]